MKPQNYKPNLYQYVQRNIKHSMKLFEALKTENVNRVSENAALYCLNRVCEYWCVAKTLRMDTGFL